MPDILFRSHSLEKSSNDGDVITSGSITLWEDQPVSPFDVGDTFTPIPDGPPLIVKDVNIVDNVIGTVAGKVVRQWQISVKGDNDGSNGQSSSDTKYSFGIEKNSDGVTVYSGTKEVAYSGDNPNPNISLGDSFSLPVIGNLTCTKVSGNDDGSGNWTFSIEGSRTGSSSSGGQQDTQHLPDDEVTLSYEINGSTVRTVAGELIALKRSETPILRKTITVYSASDSLIATIGNTYQGGIALSENISLETIKNNGIVTSSYYKHIIEVEA